MFATARHAGVRHRAIALLSALLLSMIALPALGAISERGTVADTFTDSYDDCGFTVDVEGAFSAQYRIRQGSGETESAYFLHSLASWQETHSANGKSIVIAGQSLYNEPKASRVSGSVFEFQSIEAGQPFAVYDTDGNVLLRDRGVVRHTYLFDTEGDDVPGGIFLGTVSVRLAGPHPGWDFDWGVVCEMLS